MNRKEAYLKLKELSRKVDRDLLKEQPATPEEFMKRSNELVLKHTRLERINDALQSFTDVLKKEMAEERKEIAVKSIDLDELPDVNFRTQIAEELTRMELIDRLCEYHEEIKELKLQIDAINERRES